MKQTILAVVAAIVLGSAAADPGAAQESGAQASPVGGKPPPPPADYAYIKGEVYIDGDLVIGCREFAEDFEGFYDERGDQGQARSVLERCKEAGLPGLRIPAEVRQEIQRDTGKGGLPDTGGSPILPLAAGLLLSGVGLLVLRK